jgi:putative Holliday junction resolvase
MTQATPDTSAGTAVLGFDFGTKRIGVAVGQTITSSASPLGAVRATDGHPDWDHIARLVRDWKPAALVVGLPYNMDDSEAEVAPRARRFARQLEGRFRLPVHLVDERLTSVEAARHLGPGAAENGRLDSLAATFILETWLRD